MLSDKTKLIIATNRQNYQDIPDFETKIIEPIYDFYGVEPTILLRPSACQVQDETLRIAHQQLAPIIVPIGGDGTVNWHLNNMPLYSPRTILAPYPGGTANDISTTINGKKASLATILKHGHLRQVHPLQIAINGQACQALGYIGLGLSGTCAEVINCAENPKPSKFKDSLRVVKGVVKTKKMSLIDEDGLPLNAQEIVAMNTRMASFMWPAKQRSSFFDTHFNLIVSETYGSMAKMAITGLAKQIKGQKIEKDQMVRLYKPNDGQPITAQTDGEYFKISEGEILISKNNQPIKIFSLNAVWARLNAKNYYNL
jgi:diacylglycerol kinase family enzyme